MRLSAILGLFLVLSGVVLLLTNPLQWIFFIDNKEHNLTLAENVSANSTFYELNFTFDRGYISNIYELNNGEKIYQNFLNIYCSEFLDNTSTEAITDIKLNSNHYFPTNKTYQYSLALDRETLMPVSQSIEIVKTYGLSIDKIELNYVGGDYSNYDFYGLVIFLTGLLPLLAGLLIIIVSA